MYLIYIDGSCSNFNNRDDNYHSIGGWGAVICLENNPEVIVKTIHGGPYYNTTSNIMELKALINTIKYLRIPNKNITFYTDSLYVVNGVKSLNKWLIIKNHASIKNLNYWLIWLNILKIYHGYDNKPVIDVKWIARSSHPFNKLADNLAKNAKTIKI